MFSSHYRIEDVEKEVLLPMLTQETVLLDLDPYSLKTYNVMQAGIILNAVDSERVDQVSRHRFVTRATRS